MTGCGDSPSDRGLTGASREVDGNVVGMGKLKSDRF